MFAKSELDEFINNIYFRWVNKGSDVSCLELAEALANETPVRLDLLLSLAPPPVSDKLVVTDEVCQIFLY